MMKTCEDCGCRIYSGHCVNCHEEVFIVEQYYEDNLPLPDPESELMTKYAQQVYNPSK